MTEAEALGQIYHQFNSSTRTAQWVCTAAQKQAGPREGWACDQEDSTVAVLDLLMAEVREGDSLKTYIVASSVPAHASMGYDCHACAPAIGAAVFQWKDGHWIVQSVNPAIGFYGSWGEAPNIDLVTVGPQKRGFLLSMSNEAQGYSDSSSVLLLPIGSTISAVWDLGDEDDNLGICDPQEGKCLFWRSSAAFHFIPSEQVSAYYDIEVISRGRDRQDFNHPLVSENWTDVYRFNRDEYRLIRHTAFTESKRYAESPTGTPER